MRKLYPSELTILKMHGNGASPEAMIAMMLGSKMSSTYHEEYTIGGSGSGSSSGSGSGSGSGNGEKVDNKQYPGDGAASYLLSGKGYQETVHLSTGEGEYSYQVLGRYGTITADGKALGQGTTFKDLSSSDVRMVLDLDQATFGGSELKNSGWDQVVLKNSDIIAMDLPVIKTKNGNYIPDFSRMKKMQQADLEIRKSNLDPNDIKNEEKINEIYQKNGLPPKYINGKLNIGEWKRFAAVDVVTDERVLKRKEAIMEGTIKEIDDDDERDMYEQTIQTKYKDYDLDDGWLWTDLGKDALYEGKVFIPIREDYVAAAMSEGRPFANLTGQSQMIHDKQYLGKAANY